MIDNIKFAAFVMTYERSEILAETINKILSQTFPPSKILIVDNSASKLTEKLINELNDSRLEYFRVGYNSGPAGAAYYGLKILSEQEYDWIYWGDDDDPPAKSDYFEKLLNLAFHHPQKCGQVGVVGQFFDKQKGIIERVDTELLKKTKSIEVDTIGGGMCKIINSEVVRGGVLPDPDKFFGFEELDFDIRCKKLGYSLVVDSSLFLESRAERNRLNFTRKSGSKIEEGVLWREYYSIRNLLIIFAEQKLILAYILLLMRKFYRIINGFSYGFSYGVICARTIIRGLFDGITFKKGATDLTKL